MIVGSTHQKIIFFVAVRDLMIEQDPDRFGHLLDMPWHRVFITPARGKGEAFMPLTSALVGRCRWSVNVYEFGRKPEIDDYFRMVAMHEIWPVESSEDFARREVPQMKSKLGLVSVQKAVRAIELLRRAGIDQRFALNADSSPFGDNYITKQAYALSTFLDRS